MNPSNPVPSPEQQEALRAQKEAGMEARIAQHRVDNPDAAVDGFAEAAASNKSIENDAARNQRIEARKNGDEVAQLDIEASDAIYGTRDRQATVKNPGGKGTHKRTVKGKLGKIDSIREDRIYGNGQAERDERAKEYKNQVEELFEEFGGRDGDGSLAKAKLAMDLREEAWSDAEEAETRILEKTHHLIEQGANPQGSEDQASPRERATAFVDKKMKDSESNVSDEVRLHIIKNLGENGVFTREDYEKAKQEYINQGGDITKLDRSATESEAEAPAADESPVVEPEQPEIKENPEEEIEQLIDDANNGNEPPESPKRRKLSDRFRDFCVRLAHGGGEKGDKARKALRYGVIGAIGAGAVIGVNELIDGDNTTTLYEITGNDGTLGVGDGTPGQAGGPGAGFDGDTMIDPLNSGDLSSAGSGQFNVEYGNGFTHEIMDYAQAHGIKDVTPEQAFQIYEHLEDKHGADLINVLGDSEKTDTYMMGDGNYGIDAPGKAVWADGVEDTIRKDLGLPGADIDAGQAGLSGNEPVSETNTAATSSDNGENTAVISKTTGDGDPLEENIALGATGAAVGIGAAYYADRQRNRDGNDEQPEQPTPPSQERPAAESPTEVDHRQSRRIEERMDFLEKRTVEMQNVILEQNRLINFIFAQLPPEEQARISKAWQEQQDQAAQEREKRQQRARR